MSVMTHYEIMSAYLTDGETCCKLCCDAEPSDRWPQSEHLESDDLCYCSYCRVLLDVKLSDHGIATEVRNLLSYLRCTDDELVGTGRLSGRYKGKPMYCHARDVANHLIDRYRKRLTIDQRLLVLTVLERIDIVTFERGMTEVA